MKLPASKSEQVEHARAFKVQRYALAASIILGPLSVALFVYSGLLVFSARPSRLPLRLALLATCCTSSAGSPPPSSSP